MIFFSWNVNGVRACWNKGYLPELIKDKRPDFLCLQEVKAQADQSPMTGIDDYHVTWSSAAKKGYSGTAILSREQPLKTQLNFDDSLAKKYPLLKDNYGDTNDEGRLITLEFDHFYLITTYVPNSKGDLTRLKLRHQAWEPALLEHCSKLRVKKPVLICGDLNVAHQAIDLARPKDNQGKHGFTREERESLQKLLDSGLIDSFRHFNPDKPDSYTWWTAWRNAREKNVGWRIDYWLVDQKLKPKLRAAEIHPEILGSDHCPVSIELS